jgi:HEAT repeat protein
MTCDNQVQASACLQQIEKLERSVMVEKQSADASFLLSFLAKVQSVACAEDWLVRAKALVVIGRIGDRSAAGELLAGVENIMEEPVCWRLQFLDAWWQLPLSSAEKLAALGRILQNDKQSPVVWRAAIWCLGRMRGAEALRALAEFITKPQSGVILDDLLADSWYRLAETVSEDELAAILGEFPQVRCWLGYRTWEDPLDFGFYPGSDYLLQQAMELGVSRKEFKRIYFYPRNKKNIEGNTGVRLNGQE